LTLISTALAAVLLLSTACTQVVSTGSSLKSIDETNSAEEDTARVNDEIYEDGASADDEAYDASEPADVLLRFQNANNSRDLQALMDCYDPEHPEASQAVGEGLGGALSELLFGFSAEVDAKKLMPFFSKAWTEFGTSR
jgi:hypothetical protein